MVRLSGQSRTSRRWNSLPHLCGLTRPADPRMRNEVFMEQFCILSDKKAQIVVKSFPHIRRMIAIS